MAVLGLGIDGRLEEGEALTAWGLGTADSWQWQALVSGTWVNVGAPGDARYVIPTGAAGTSYRLAATSEGVTSYSPVTGAAIVDTRKMNAPYLTGPEYASIGWEDGTPHTVFGWLNFSDADKGHYGGGSLLLQDSTSRIYGGDGHDILGVRSTGIYAGQFSYNAATGEVRYAFTSGNPIVVGTVDSTLNGNGTDLKIVFNNNATVAVVIALIDNLQSTNTDDSPTPNRLFTLRITDPTGASAQRVTAFGLENTPDAPVFTSGSSVSVDENQTAVSSVTAIDPDRELDQPQGISYTLAAGQGDADNGRFMVDAATGALRFSTAPDFEDSSHGTQYSVRVRATDSEGSIVEQAISVTVRDVNDAPVASALTRLAGENAPAVSFDAVYADQDSGDTHTITFDTTGTLGNVTLNGQTFTYDPVGQFEQLPAWRDAADTFTYTVTDAAGLSSTRTVTMWVAGENDAATITGLATASLREDVGVDFGGTLGASGRLFVSDVDQFEAMLNPPGSGNSGPGSFTVSAGGEWWYRLANSRVQSLGAGETLIDSLVVSSMDGTASQELRVTITGTNDLPRVTAGGNAGSVTEAGVSGAGTSQAAGTLSAVDADANDTLSWSGGANGAYGRFEIDSATGQWTYALDNAAAATQALAQGQTVVETFTATVRDTAGGTAQQQVKVTVNGANDAPVIGTSSDLTGLVQEPTIGTGMLVLDLATTYGQDSTVVDTAGRVVVIGQALDGDGIWTPTIARLQADGSADTAFGDGGTASLSTFFRPASIAVDPVGRYVSAGYTYANYSGSQLDWAIERRHPDGSLDTTFGNGGLVTLDFGGYDQARSVDVSAAGRILVSGYIPDPELGMSRLTVLALEGNGAPDLDFGANGRAVFGDAVGAVVVDSQGRVVGWGLTMNPDTGSTQLYIERHLPDGSIDTSFGEAGVAILDLQSDAVQVSQLAVGSSGQILLGWTQFTGDWGYQPFTLALVRPDGSVETGFGNAGRVQTGLNAETLELSFDAQGRPLAGFSGPVAADFQLARFNFDGTLDTSFHVGGTTSADLGGEETVEAIHFLSTGEILVAGTSWQGTSSTLNAGFASFDGEGNLNTRFGETQATALETSGTLYVVGNGWDNGDTAQWTGSATGLYGTFQLTAQGSWTYVLDPDNPATQALEEGTTGTERFTATVTDSFGASASCEVVVTVVGSYDPPPA